MAQSITEIIENILTQQSQLTETVNIHNNELAMIYKRTIELQSEINQLKKENKDGSKK